MINSTLKCFNTNSFKSKTFTKQTPWESGTNVPPPPVSQMSLPHLNLEQEVAQMLYLIQLKLWPLPAVIHSKRKPVYIDNGQCLRSYKYMYVLLVTGSDNKRTSSANRALMPQPDVFWCDSWFILPWNRDYRDTLIAKCKHQDSESVITNQRNYNLDFCLTLTVEFCLYH